MEKGEPRLPEGVPGAKRRREIEKNFPKKMRDFSAFDEKA